MSIIPCLRSTVDNKLTANAVFFLIFSYAYFFLYKNTSDSATTAIPFSIA